MGISVVRFFKQCLHSTDRSSDEYLAGKCLRENSSYRLDVSSETDRMLGFREMKRVWTRWKSPKRGLIPMDKETSVAVLSSNEANQDIIIYYIERSASKKIGVWISKDDLCGDPEFSFFEFSLFWFTALGWSLGIFIKSSSRANRALLIREIYENAILVNEIQARGLKHIYHFVPYEKDANVFSLLMKKLQVKCTFIPSAGPISKHNHTMIADEIVLVTPYQMEEYERKWKDQIRFEKLLRWIPERAFTYIDLYRNRTFQFHEKTIGYYSHGSWVRLKHKHHSAELAAKKEEWILSLLKLYVESHPDVNLIIFPHPRERKTELLEETKAYYSKHVGVDRVAISSNEKSSAESFDQVELAVAAYSSIVYERLFCGFKMIIGSQERTGFPMENSSLSQIVFYNYSEMEHFVDDAFGMPNDAFFKQYGIDSFHYSNYSF
ncbi:MAG: hypothetical protein ACOYLH_04345 [Flavobacteriales bacterium]